MAFRANEQSASIVGLIAVSIATLSSACSDDATSLAAAAGASGQAGGGATSMSGSGTTSTTAGASSAGTSSSQGGSLGATGGATTEGGGGAAAGSAGSAGTAAGSGGSGGSIEQPPLCTVPTTGGVSLSKLLSAPQSVEAESATLDGSAVVAMDGSGFEGDGFADMKGGEGSLIWLLDVPAGGE